MLAVYSGLPCLTMREGFSACFRCMGQHVLPAGSNLRNIVFRDQILFVELDHGFQFTIPDSCLLLLPDIPAVFTLTGKKRLSESCVPIRPFQFLSPREEQMTCPTLWVFVVRVTRRYTANAETDKKQPSNGELPFVSHRDSFCLWPWADHTLHNQADHPEGIWLPQHPEHARYGLSGLLWFTGSISITQSEIENRLIRTIAGVVGDFHLLSPLKSLYTHSLMTPLPYLPAAKSVFFEIRIQAGDLWRHDLQKPHRLFKFLQCLQRYLSELRGILIFIGEQLDCYEVTVVKR